MGTFLKLYGIAFTVFLVVDLVKFNCLEALSKPNWIFT